MSALATAYRYIARIDGIRSGRPIIEGTRIAVHDVMGLILNGAEIDDVIRSFPALTRSQVYECLAYYEDNKDDIDLLVATQMAEADG